MKTAPITLTGANVATLACALLVGHMLLPYVHEANSVRTVSSMQAELSPEAANVLVPNARDGSELERIEHQSDEEHVLSQRPGPASNSKATYESPTLSKEELMSALEQDLEPWEREPVQLGGPLGPQKSTLLLASTLTDEELWSAIEQDLETWEREPVKLGGLLGKQESKLFIAPTMTEEDLMSALEQDLEPWERETAQPGGLLGPQQSTLVLAPKLTDEDLLSAIDQDLEPWEREPGQLGGSFGPQKSKLIFANAK